MFVKKQHIRKLYIIQINKCNPIFKTNVYALFLLGSVHSCMLVCVWVVKR